MNTQDISQALRELEPEEAAQLALDTLRNLGYAVSAYCRDDIVSAVDDLIDNENDLLDAEDDEIVVNADELEHIVNAVQDSYTWRKTLQEATEYDWDAITDAIREARASFKG